MPKFTKRGDDLVDSEIYHPAKFHRPMSFHAQDIRYHVMKVLRTKKKHMPIAVTANSLQHWPSLTMRRAVFHRSATVGQACRTGLTIVKHVLNFKIFWPRRLTPGPKFTKMGEDLLSTWIYHPTKFQPDHANGLRDMRYQSFPHFVA